MELTEDGKRLMKMVDMIQVPQIKEFVLAFFEQKVPDYFWTMPASTTGKYHPAYCLGEGGLVRHTIAATIFLSDILKLRYYQELYTELERDQMLAAIILHDTFKCGLPGTSNYSVTNHADIACEQINLFLGREKTSIGRLVETHMGQWGKEKPNTPMEELVHDADYYASRKYIAVAF